MTDSPAPASAPAPAPAPPEAGQAAPAPAGLPGRAASLAYAAACYLAFLAAFLYSIGFVGNFMAPRSIDAGPDATLAEALAVDLLLLGLFAVQHSVMARPAFKRWWAQVVPWHAERSTYVLATSLALALLFWQWRPIPGAVWDVRHPAGSAALWALFGLGWLLVLASTFLIDHFDLFGLRQAWMHFRGEPYMPPPFATPSLYRIIRHPIMLGFLVAFWATPAMTWGHLLFAAMTTAYIFVGIALEERDLREAYGSRYEEYSRQVGMILPWPGQGGPAR